MYGMCTNSAGAWIVYTRLMTKMNKNLEDGIFMTDTETHSLCIRLRREGEIGSFQHKSPHQARAFRRGIDVMTLILPYQRCSMYFLVQISEMAKLNRSVKCIGENVRWADLTIRFVVKTISMTEYGIYIDHILGECTIFQLPMNETS